MKATVDTKEFATALKKVSDALVRNAAISFMAEARVDFNSGLCTVTGTDLNLWLMANLPADGDDFSFLFTDTRLVMKTLGYFSGEVTLELNGDTLKVIGGNKEAVFTVEDTKMYPEQPNEAFERICNADAAKLHKSIQRISYATVVSDSNISLRGVRFEGSRIWCLDGCRIAMTDGAFDTSDRFILPAKELCNLKHFGDSTVEIGVGKKYVFITNSVFTMILRIIEAADRLEVEKLIPKSSTETYFIDRREYMDAIDYLSDSTRERNTNPVLFEKGKLTLEGKNSRSGVTVSVDGEAEIRYAMDLRYIRDALGQFAGSNKVKISATSEFSPIVITAENTTDLALILPVRTRNEWRRAA